MKIIYKTDNDLKTIQEAKLKEKIEEKFGKDVTIEQIEDKAYNIDIEIDNETERDKHTPDSVTDSALRELRKRGFTDKEISLVQLGEYKHA